MLILFSTNPFRLNKGRKTRKHNANIFLKELRKKNMMSPRRNKIIPISGLPHSNHPRGPNYLQKKIKVSITDGGMRERSSFCRALPSAGFQGVYITSPPRRSDSLDILCGRPILPSIGVFLRTMFEDRLRQRRDYDNITQVDV